jgi:hypothetical protein
MRRQSRKLSTSSLLLTATIHIAATYIWFRALERSLPML